MKKLRRDAGLSGLEDRAAVAPERPRAVQALRRLSYDEQVEAVRPPQKMPALSASGGAVQFEGEDDKEKIKGITYSGRNIVVIDGNAYYQSSGQANKLGGLQKPEGTWYQIWGVQEVSGAKFFGNDVPDGWIMKQTLKHTSLVKGPDMTPYVVEYGADMPDAESVNDWLRSQGMTPFTNVEDSGD